MGRIKKINTDVELDRFHPGDTKRLLQFNITKQRIVDLCNKEFKDDPFDEAKNYSTWNRAMNGDDVWEGIVIALDGLYEKQKEHPRQYLPQDEPGGDLREWMAQIAKATWWHKTLKLDMSLNVLNSWFSGRVTKTRPELTEKVGVWWERVKAAADEAERHSAVHWRDREMERERKRSSYDPQRPVLESWDTWCKDLIEDGLSIDQVRERYVEEGLLRDLNHLSLIDLSDPQSPLDSSTYAINNQERQRSWRGQEFDALHETGFPLALSRTPPEFDPEPFIEERRWGDRRNEDCPRDINFHLYCKHYRERCQRKWDAESRCVVVDSEIVEVSTDGEIWREANETEKKGWERGIYYWEQALIADADTNNSYTRELEEAKTNDRRARREYEGNCEPAKDSTLKAAFLAAKRELEIAYDNTHGQYD